jgi:hypothetical protein
MVYCGFSGYAGIFLAIGGVGWMLQVTHITCGQGLNRTG